MIPLYKAILYTIFRYNDLRQLWLSFDLRVTIFRYTTKKLAKPLCKSFVMCSRQAAKLMIRSTEHITLRLTILEHILTAWRVMSLL